MRKLIVALMVVGGLLIVAAPAKAQLGDPLTLAASGVLIPYFTSSSTFTPPNILTGGDVTLLEVASPVGKNTDPDIHMFFFDRNCNRADSVGFPLTTNDIAFLNIVDVPTLSVTPPGWINVQELHLGTNPANSTPGGLIALAARNGDNSLAPLQNPIHARAYAFNVPTGKSRIITPITLSTAEAPGLNPFVFPWVWNPLRTGATFFAPQEGAVTSTTLWLVCPKNTVTTGLPAPFPPSKFPAVTPPFPASFSSDPVIGALFFQIYDTNEVFIHDTHTGCNCLQQNKITDISTVYATGSAALGTYTEITSNPLHTPGDFVFTGFRSVATAPLTSVANEFFGRLSNGSRESLQGVLTSKP